MSHKQAEINSMSPLRFIANLILCCGILLLVLCSCGGNESEGTAVSATANALATRIMAAAVVIDHNQDCFPPRDCTLQKIDPAEFTIDKLLVVAEHVGNLNIPDHPAEITFSQTYGYPTAISYEDGFWSLTQFQPTGP